jgi:hypothetical protein
MFVMKNLQKAIKNKATVRWIKKDGYSYILTEHFVLKTNEEIKGSALTTLIKILGNIPQSGQGLSCRCELKNELSQKDIENTIKLIDIPDEHKPIYFTSLVHQSKDGSECIFKAQEYVFVNKIYVDLINVYEKGIKIYGSNAVSPLYFSKGTEILMVLPIKMKPCEYLNNK